MNAPREWSMIKIQTIQVKHTPNQVRKVIEFVIFRDEFNFVNIRILAELLKGPVKVFHPPLTGDRLNLDRDE